MSAELHAFQPEEVMAYLDGEVKGARALALADHLENCATCSSLANDFCVLSQQLSSWREQPSSLHEPPREADQKIPAERATEMVCTEFPDGLPSSYREPATSWTVFSLVRNRWAWALAGASVLAVVLSAQFFKLSRTPLGHPTTSIPNVYEEMSKERAKAAKLNDDMNQEVTAIDTSVHSELATKPGSHDISGVRTDLDTTPEDLRMAKSEMGTPIARNHDEINQLRRLGERHYTEFTLTGKNRPQKVANVTLELRNVNEKRNAFDLALTVEDKLFVKRNRAANEPIFFYTTGTHIPEEVVINKIGKDSVSGYVSVSVGKMIERTASLSLIVKDLEAGRTSLEEITRNHDGYFAELSTSGQSNTARTLTASVRVPSSQLDSTLGELRKLGELDEEKQGGEEVSRQYVDLKARLENGRNTEKRLTELLAKRADGLKDVLNVERELASTRDEIERMEAEQRNLTQQVNYASIELKLREQYKPALNLAPPDASTRMRNALVDGYHAMVESALGLLLFLLQQGPTTVFWLLLLFFPARWTWRRVRPAIFQKQSVAGAA